MTTVQHMLFVLLLQFACLESFDAKQSIRSMKHTNGSHPCPQPTVGNCSCEWTGPYVKVTCVGLDTVPEKVPESALYITFFNGTIKEIPQNFFLSFKNLITLNLKENKISNKFKLPKSLFNLFLDNNCLNASTIFGMFDGLTRLRALHLSWNPLGEKLVPGTFSSVKNVIELTLANCLLEDVGENMFLGLTNLRTLKIFGNKIRTLKRGAFRGISCPKGETSLTLKLVDNLISHIEDGAFEGVHGLFRLSLDGNQLSSFPNLTGFPKFSDLTLSQNNIVDASSLTHSGIKQLENLLLNNNQISVIPEDLFKHIIIRTLDLSSNRIKEIPPRFLENPKTPQIINNLYLYDNEIEFVHSESFAGLPNLKTLPPPITNIKALMRIL
ncbi:leucine-rich repeat-containing G-protein coupled receptor 5-like [Actinia tenebrosa]|uniref:Leucine-rich repeat-containing G-protein coupled receptor 5-like n=1 Tax=Actinia tenebrosa TaxID=6105 RepID=A0A6P8IZ84_ACTTE|nr:leucine-rich repeat-containing G-protein coupled receptor 5-like [Actinia tenebrosa]